MSLSNVSEFEVSTRSGGKGANNPDFVEMEQMGVGETLTFSLSDKSKYWYNHARWRMNQFAKKNNRKYLITKGKARLHSGEHVMAMRIERTL